MERRGFRQPWLPQRREKFPVKMADWLFPNLGADQAMKEEGFRLHKLGKGVQEHGENLRFLESNVPTMDKH